MDLIDIEKSADYLRQLDSTNCKGKVFNIVVGILTLSPLEDTSQVTQYYNEHI
jgi:hypothetical protein